MRTKSIAYKSIHKNVCLPLQFTAFFKLNNCTLAKMEIRALHICVLVFVASCVYAKGPHYDLSKTPELFEKFVRDYNRNYQNTYDAVIHYEAFKKNLEMINMSNRVSDSITFGINKFADYTQGELEKILDPNDPLVFIVSVRSNNYNL